MVHHTTDYNLQMKKKKNGATDKKTPWMNFKTIMLNLKEARLKRIHSV